MKKNVSRRKLSNDYNFAKLFPDLLKDWNFGKKKKQPHQFYPSSHCIVSWKCHKCGHEWDTTIKNRSLNKTKCPMCSEKILTYDLSLQGKFPEIAAQWHPTKNGDLTPYDVLPNSSRIVWWQGQGPECGSHEWKQSVSKRNPDKIAREACPKCKK